EEYYLSKKDGELVASTIMRSGTSLLVGEETAPRSGPGRPAGRGIYPGRSGPDVAGANPAAHPAGARGAGV
nr:hypothetical protein [Tanacetum cinerariifolium]